MSGQGKSSDDDDLFLIEGVLTELHVELGRQNLLEKIARHYRSNSVVTGVGAVVGDMFGQAANAAALAMHDGEDTQNFACMIGDQIVCGQFAGAEFLKVGNKVKAVVSRHSEVLAAGAVLDEAQGYLWIGHPWGERAEMLGNLKLGFWLWAFAICGFVALAAILGTGTWTLREVITRIGGGSAAIFLVAAAWSNRGMRALAGPSTTMFRLLGFADPASINLNGYRVSIVHFADNTPSPSGVPFADLSQYQKRDVFCYKVAIEKGRISIASQ